jgi:hypothetical protein
VQGLVSQAQPLPKEEDGMSLLKMSLWSAALALAVGEAASRPAWQETRLADAPRDVMPWYVCDEQGCLSDFKYATDRAR